LLTEAHVRTATSHLAKLEWATATPTGLAEAGTVLHVRADDDPAGQEIVSGIIKAIPGVRLWRFVLRVPVTSRYEEQDIDVLLCDLRGDGIRTQEDGESRVAGVRRDHVPGARLAVA
jgi:hypothetical protein